MDRISSFTGSCLFVVVSVLHFRLTLTLLTISPLSSSPELNLDYVLDNPWMVVPTSALRNVNIDRVIDWLIQQPSK